MPKEAWSPNFWFVGQKYDQETASGNIGMNYQNIIKNLETAATGTILRAKPQYYLTLVHPGM